MGNRCRMVRCLWDWYSNTGYNTRSCSITSKCCLVSRGIRRCGIIIWCLLICKEVWWIQRRLCICCLFLRLYSIISDGEIDTQQIKLTHNMTSPYKRLCMIQKKVMIHHSMMKTCLARMILTYIEVPSVQFSLNFLYLVIHPACSCWNLSHRWMVFVIIRQLCDLIELVTVIIEDRDNIL